VHRQSGADRSRRLDQKRPRHDAPPTVSAASVSCEKLNRRRTAPHFIRGILPGCDSLNSATSTAGSGQDRSRERHGSVKPPGSLVPPYDKSQVISLSAVSRVVLDMNQRSLRRIQARPRWSACSVCANTRDYPGLFRLGERPRDCRQYARLAVSQTRCAASAVRVIDPRARLIDLQIQRRYRHSGRTAGPTTPTPARYRANPGRLVGTGKPRSGETPRCSSGSDAERRRRPARYRGAASFDPCGWGAARVL